MSRTLAEDIERGRRAIELARQRGIDTSAWEQTLAEMEQQALLAWASELAEQDLVLEKPVSFVEAPRRTLTTERVSEKAARYLRVISYACLQQRTRGMGRFKPPWWKEREEEALGALSALREAMEGQQEKEPES